MIFLAVLLGMIYYFDHSAQGMDVHNLTIFFTFFVMLQFWNLFNARVFGTTDSAFKGLSKSYGMELIVLAILVGQFLIVPVRWSCIPHRAARLADVASDYRRFVHGVMGWRTYSPCST